MYGDKKKKKRSRASKVKFTSHLLTLNLRKVEELVRMKNSGGIVISKEMQTIQDDTDRVIEDQVAEKYEFRYKGTNNFVKKGTHYHIHYTKYLKEYYMTSMSHDSILSRLIIRRSNFTEFNKYNKLNSQSPMHLTALTPKPTTEDYKNGYMERHFARKSNQNSSPFEIHPSDNGVSPLYTYVTIRWKIAGRKNVVKFFNKAQVLIASKTFSNIQRLLPDFQYSRAEDLSAEENIRQSLGITDNPQVTKTQATTTQATTPSSGHNAGSGGTPTGGGGY
jgi:hypothetical protein